MNVKAGMTVGSLVDEMAKSGVLGAGKLANAVDVMVEMFKNPEYTVFLSLAGPMVLGGLRKIISDLIDGEYVNVIVTSGGNIVHDIIESLGYRSIKGSFFASDKRLKEKGLGRVGDIYVEQEDFKALEKEIYRVLDSLPKTNKERVAINQLLHDIGKSIDDEDSILKKASIHNTPIFSPGVLDSMLGLHLWTYGQLKTLIIDPLLDFNRLSEIVFNSKKSGVIILGGGVPKHHVLAANILRGGVDAAVQVTLDRPEGGSLSGAPLEEAISWKKAKSGKRLVTVIGDATIIFPIMVAATLERLKDERRE